jgi:hypothetical protein
MLPEYPSPFIGFNRLAWAMIDSSPWKKPADAGCGDWRPAQTLIF